MVDLIGKCVTYNWTFQEIITKGVEGVRRDPATASTLPVQVCSVSTSEKDVDAELSKKMDEAQKHSPSFHPALVSRPTNRKFKTQFTTFLDTNAIKEYFKGVLFADLWLKK